MILLAAVAAMLAAIAVSGRRRPSQGRVAAVWGARSIPAADDADHADRAADHARGPIRIVSAAAVLLASALVIGGPFGWVVGLAGAAAVAVGRPRVAGHEVDPDDLAVVVDLVAGCLAAGTGLAAALDAASIAADDGLQAHCRAVAGALRAGVPPDEAWQTWLADAWLSPVARTAVRTSATGAAAAADLRRTAVRLRARRRAAAQHRVRQASVWLVAPLGLCFLPAFVLVAVVPLVLGLVPTLR